MQLSLEQVPISEALALFSGVTLGKCLHSGKMSNSETQAVSGLGKCSSLVCTETLPFPEEKLRRGWLWLGIDVVHEGRG